MVDVKTEKGDEKARRELKGVYEKILLIITVAMSLFHLYVLGLYPINPWILYAIHLTFGILIIMSQYPSAAGSPRDRFTVWDIFLALLGSTACVYIVWNYDELITRIPVMPTHWDLFLGVVTTLIVLEIGRRTVGFLLPTVAILFLLYAHFGDLIPGTFGHKGYGWERIIAQMYSMEGIFGLALGVSATYIVLFIVFSGFLHVSGGGKFFIDIALAVAGRLVGGPAKIAIVGSSLFGTISGSPIANVMAIGTFTIPLMKKTGFRAYYAGAIEAAASTGGQIMPPVMGAGAFIMADVLGIPLGKVLIAAAIPAILYYLALYVMVHIQATKTGLYGLPDESVPAVPKVLKARGHLLLPLFVLITVLISGASPIQAAIFATIATVMIAMVRRETRLNFSKILTGLSIGARNAMEPLAACACAGIVVGAISLTGLGVKFAGGVVSLAGGNVLLILVLSALVCLVLGMGLPTTAAYIIVASVVAPALIQVGINPLAAHMFLFYFACISSITPPVALAAYAAAGVAGANMVDVGITAVRLGIVGFIVPFMFVYETVLLFAGSYPEILLALVTGSLGVIALGVAFERWLWGELSYLASGLLIVAALLLVKPGWITDLSGAGIFIGVIALRISRYAGWKEEEKMRRAALAEGKGSAAGS
jgi:TRAP transporter 4TM/12TM fusion protein